jgi:hypothetical protein
MSWLGVPVEFFHLSRNAESFSQFSQDIVMVKHEAHSVTVSINSADALAESSGQVVKAFEQYVCQDRSFQMAPKSLDQVETRAVRRQPVDRDPIGIGLDPLLDCTRVVEPPVVTHQANLATSVRLDQGDQEDEEIHSTLAVGNCVGDLARCIIHAAVHDLLLVLTRCWDLRLLPDRPPHPRQRRMPVNLNFVLEDESLRGILLQRFFFSRRNCILAFA